MKYISITLLMSSILLLIISGSCNTKWSEAKKQDFEKQCMQTDTINDLNIAFIGFNYDEIEKTVIKRIHKGVVVDSFNITVNINSHDPKRNQYWAYIEKTVHLRDIYHIIVPNQQTFILSNMRMVMWPQFTMFSEGYGCRLGEYRIDSEKFEYNSNPHFIKKGYQFEW